MAGYFSTFKNPFIPSSDVTSKLMQPKSSIPENEVLTSELIQLGLNEKKISFIIQNGDKFFDKTQLLAQKLSI